MPLQCKTTHVHTLTLLKRIQKKKSNTSLITPHKLYIKSSCVYRTKRRKKKNYSCMCLSRGESQRSYDEGRNVLKFVLLVADHHGNQNGYLNLEHTWPVNSSTFSHCFTIKALKNNMLYALKTSLVGPTRSLEKKTNLFHRSERKL